MQEFHPSRIRLLVFELDSLTLNFEQDAWDNFRQYLRVLDDRDFAIVLIAESIQASEWASFAKISVIKSTGEEAFKTILHCQVQTFFGFQSKILYKQNYQLLMQILQAAAEKPHKTEDCNIKIYTILCRYLIPVK